MIRLDPQSFYTRADLAQLLEGSGVDVDTFISRLKPRKVFKKLYGGSDLLAAYAAASALCEDPAPTQEKPPLARRRRARSAAASAVSVAPGDALLAEFAPKELRRA